VRYVLDTTLLIDHVHGHPDGVAMLAQLFEETGDLYTCAVVTCEALSKGDPLERQAIATLLDALEYVGLDPEAARWAGERRRALSADGSRHPVADALIAATAWRLDAIVVTRNAADFARFGVPVLAYGGASDRGPGGAPHQELAVDR
jgi:predicted nucleic acid-binding protein